MLKRIKSLFFAITLAFCILSFSTKATFAAPEEDSTWYNQPFNTWYSKVYGQETPQSEIFGERYTAAQVQWIVWGLLSQPINYLGKDNQELIACVMKYVGSDTLDLSDCSSGITNLLTRAKDFFQSINVVGYNTDKNFVELVFDYQNRPISGLRYVSNLSLKYNLIPQANAQGFGYKNLDPIKEYWSGVRNVAYSIIVFVIIVFSFMIMFRVKLSPQLVISVQSALPKVITALILATFSYAIAGFMIDLMYVIGGLMAALLNLAKFSSNFEWAYFSIFPNDVKTGLGILILMLAYTIMFAVAVILSFVVGLTTMSFIPATLVSIIMVLVAIACVFVTIWYAFRVPYVLIKTLISVYASIIFGPLQIAFGAISPQVGFGSWLKKLFADLLVFPTTGLFMFMAWSLLWTAYIYIAKTLTNVNILDLVNEIIKINGGNQFIPDSLWVPSIIGLAENIAPMIWLMASFGIILAIPKVPDILKMLILGAKFDFGSAIGEVTGPVSTGLRLSSTVAEVGKNYSTGWGFNLKPKEKQKISGGNNQNNGPKWYEQD